MSDTEKKTGSKTFKEYYADPEFKKKHLAYVKEKVMCDCGKEISRSNMSAHVKTKLHQKKLDRSVLEDIKKKYLDMILQEQIKNNK